MVKAKTEYKIIKIDPETHKRIRVAAAFEGCSISEMVQRMAKEVPMIGYIQDGKVILNSEA